MHFLREYLFLIPLVVMILSEIVKVAIDGIRTGEWHDKFFRPGGMPSTHSAFSTSLLIVVGYKLGAQSTEFAIAFVFSCIVWYDAIAIRKAVGEQGAVLNRLQKWQHFTERLGHSAKQVLAGIIFGAFVTLIGIWIW